MPRLARGSSICIRLGETQWRREQTLGMMRHGAPSLQSRLLHAAGKWEKNPLKHRTAQPRHWACGPGKKLVWKLLAAPGSFGMEILALTPSFLPQLPTNRASHGYRWIKSSRRVYLPCMSALTRKPLHDQTPIRLRSEEGVRLVNAARG